MRIRKLICLFDLFKKPLLLRVAKEEQISTIFGALLSLAIYALLIYYFSQSDFFFKKSPTIVIEDAQSVLSPAILYNNPLSFAVKNLYGQTLNDPSYFLLQVQLDSISFDENGISNGNVSTLPYHMCNESDSQNKEDFETLGNTFCLDNKSFILEGDLGEPVTSTLTVFVFICENSTENNNSCKSSEEIQSYLSSTTLNVNYVSPILQMKNYENPISKPYSTVMYTLDSRLSKVLSMELQKVYITSEETTILSNVKYFETYIVQNEGLDLALWHTPKDPIIKMVFHSSKNIFNVQRTYQTLVQAFTAIGGFFSFLIVVGKVLTKFDNQVYLTTTIINHLYSFQQQQSKNDDHTLNSSKLPSLFDHHNERTDSDQNQMKISKVTNVELQHKDEPLKVKIELEKPQEAKDIKLKTEHLEQKILNEEPIETQSKDFEEIKPKPVKIEDKENKYKELPLQSSKFPIEQSPKSKSLASRTKKFGGIFRRKSFAKKHEDEGMKTLEEFVKFSEKKNHISFNIFHFINVHMKKLWRCGLNFKESLFERAQNVFEEEIDIIKILQRIQDIEKLKQLLLTDKQLLLFDLMDKPMIYLENNQNKFNSSPTTNRKESTLDNYKKALDYYKELEQSKKKNPIDEKLFSLIQNHIQTFQKYFHP